MARYVALLRAVNVGGRVVKMDHLAALFEGLGFADVSTVIASGNVIFAAPGRRASGTLEHAIAAHLEEALGYEVATFLRTPAEMARIAVHDPWASTPVTGATLFVGVLGAAPGEAARRAAEGLRTAVDDLVVDGREVYWRSHGRFSNSLVGKGALEKALGTPMTVRNQTTMRRIAERLSR